MRQLKEIAKTHGQWVMVLTALATAITTAVLDRFFPEEVEVVKKNHEAVVEAVGANTKAIEEAIADLDDALLREKERRRMVERHIRDLEDRRCEGAPRGTMAIPTEVPSVPDEPEVAPVPDEPEAASSVVHARRPRVGERLRASMRQIPDFQAQE